jgi:hypothetical protein
MATNNNIMLLNPERKPLTIEKFRQLSGRKDISDEQATEIIDSINILVKILYQATKRTEAMATDEPKVVNLFDGPNKLNSAA